MPGHQTYTDASCMDYLYCTGCIHNNLFKQMSADFIRATAFAIRLVAVAVLVWAIRWW
ncbi:membrane protein [Escherichia coli]|nr:membrane protein [Escherichia coli]KJA00576.1 membrane protein [Escherichia coli]